MKKKEIWSLIFVGRYGYSYVDFTTKELADIAYDKISNLLDRAADMSSAPRDAKYFPIITVSPTRRE